MSTLKAEVVAIDEVVKHPNADRLDLVKVKGWNVVAGREVPTEPRYKAGDKCLYIPIDSILPSDLEEYLFPADGKIHLSKSRIRTIKLRGAISQGMIVDLEGLEVLHPGISKAAKVGDDWAPILESQARSFVKNSMRHLSTNFEKYSSVQKECDELVRVRLAELYLCQQRGG